MTPSRCRGPGRARRARPGILALLGALLAVCLPAGGEPGVGFAERHRELDATERAAASDRARGPALAALRRRAGRAAGPFERVEVLRAVRHPSPKGERPEDYRRRAEVSLYDYQADLLAIAVIDLDAGAVESLTLSADAQPPLTPREVRRAMELLFADPVAGARIADAYLRITGRRLGHWRQLRYAGFVYHADATSQSPATADCGRHRCAQLLLRTKDDVSIELPIVDLSRERVLETRSFAPPGPDGAHDHAH